VKVEHSHPGSKTWHEGGQRLHRKKRRAGAWVGHLVTGQGLIAAAFVLQRYGSGGNCDNPAGIGTRCGLSVFAWGRWAGFLTCARRVDTLYSTPVRLPEAGSR
jgi:hypothetical protein